MHPGLKSATACVLAALLAAGAATGKEKISSRVYSQVTSEQVVAALVRLGEKLADNYSVIQIGTDPNSLTLKDLTRKVTLKVGVKQNSLYQAQVGVRATCDPGSPCNSDHLDQAVRMFFVFLSVEISEVRGSPSKPQIGEVQFESMRRQLIGNNIEARLSLPLWIGKDGALHFPPGRTLKPNELATITNVLLCSQYPAKSPDDCGPKPSSGRTLLVVLLNGAQLRLIPVQNQAGRSDGSWGGVFSVLDSLTCVFGGALDCIQAQQRQQQRAMEGTRAEIESARLDAERRETERAYRENVGPEIVFEIPAVQEVPLEDVSAKTIERIMETLNRYVRLIKTDQPRTP
jgi:hypothetical protein